MRALIATTLSLVLVVFTASASEACVRHASGNPFDSFQNNCSGNVIVRFISDGGQRAMTGVIRPGRIEHVTRIKPGSTYNWCSVGNKTYWTCD